MTTPPVQVVVPFQPLLKQITESLHLTEPKYKFLDEQKNNMYVIIKDIEKTKTFIYVGGEAGSVVDSCEKAAQKAVCDLVRKFDVIVENISYCRKENAARCVRLYKLKRVELELSSKSKLHSTAAVEKPNSSQKEGSQFVCMDYMMLLGVIFRKIEILSTPIETVEYAPNRYTSWITITPKNQNYGKKCIFSDDCETLSEAKQNLARKVILFLVPLCNLEIVDANYNLFDKKYGAVLLTLKRESYLTVKERVLGIQEPIESSLLLVEQDCITPTVVAFRIPNINPPPLPLKKRLTRPIEVFGTSVGNLGTKSRSFFWCPMSWRQCSKGQNNFEATSFLVC
ncbi:hypothetical protein vseg_000693 [Gypsophila vaccaria]